MLDPRVEDVLHVGPARVGDDRAVAERARAELHPALEPADDVAGGDPLRDVRERARRRRAARASRPGAPRAPRRTRSSAYAGPQYACSIDERRAAARAPGARRGSAAPTAIPESPAAGWTKTSSNGVSGRMRPLATAFSATPPARQRFGIPVRSQSASDEVQVGLLEHRLERRGDVLVQRGRARLAGLARRAEHLLQPLGEDAADRRRAARPRSCRRLPCGAGRSRGRARTASPFGLDDRAHLRRGSAASPYGARPITLPSSP